MNTIQNGKGDLPRNNWGPKWYAGYASIDWHPAPQPQLSGNSTAPKMPMKERLGPSTTTRTPQETAEPASSATSTRQRGVVVERLTPLHMRFEPQATGPAAVMGRDFPNSRISSDLESSAAGPYWGWGINE
jgi:hypothetical protein